MLLLSSSSRLKSRTQCCWKRVHHHHIAFQCHGLEKQSSWRQCWRKTTVFGHQWPILVINKLSIHWFLLHCEYSVVTSVFKWMFWGLLLLLELTWVRFFPHSWLLCFSPSAKWLRTNQWHHKSLSSLLTIFTYCLASQIHPVLYLVSLHLKTGCHCCTL